MKPGCIIFSKHLYNCKLFMFFQHNDAGYKICKSLEKQAGGRMLVVFQCFFVSQTERFCRRCMNDDCNLTFPFDLPDQSVRIVRFYFRR